MATKRKSKLVPSRGTIEDWTLQTEAKLLRKKEKYSEKMAQQEVQAEPDFQSLLRDDLKPSKKKPKAKKATAKKSRASKTRR